MVSAKSIKLRCRAVINKYRVQSNRLEEEKKLLPLGGVLYPKVSSSRNPLDVLGVRFASGLFTEGASLIGSNS